MTDVPNVNEHGLTEAQEQEVLTTFSLVDDYEINEDDLNRAREMFKTPEDFKLLRKILGIHTPNESGLTYKSADKLHEAPLENLQAYAIETALSQLADERIRTTLVSFCLTLRGHNQGVMTKDFKKKNDTAFSEAKSNEEFEAEQNEEKKLVGDNL